MKIKIHVREIRDPKTGELFFAEPCTDYEADGDEYDRDVMTDLCNVLDCIADKYLDDAITAVAVRRMEDEAAGKAVTSSKGR